MENSFKHYSDMDISALVEGMSSGVLDYSFSDLKEAQTELVNRRMSSRYMGIVSGLMRDMIEQGKVEASEADAIKGEEENAADAVFSPDLLMQENERLSGKADSKTAPVPVAAISAAPSAPKPVVADEPATATAVMEPPPAAKEPKVPKMPKESKEPEFPPPAQAAPSPPAPQIIALPQEPAELAASTLKPTPIASPPPFTIAPKPLTPVSVIEEKLNAIHGEEASLVPPIPTAPTIPTPVSVNPPPPTKSIEPPKAAPTPAFAPPPPPAPVFAPPPPPSLKASPPAPFVPPPPPIAPLPATPLMSTPTTSFNPPAAPTRTSDEKPAKKKTRPHTPVENESEYHALEFLAGFYKVLAWFLVVATLGVYAYVALTTLSGDVMMVVLAGVAAMTVSALLLLVCLAVAESIKWKVDIANKLSKL